LAILSAQYLVAQALRVFLPVAQAHQAPVALQALALQARPVLLAQARLAQALRVFLPVALALALQALQAPVALALLELSYPVALLAQVALLALPVALRRLEKFGLPNRLVTTNITVHVFTPLIIRELIMHTKDLLRTMQETGHVRQSSR
jgi:hypothetical protein